MISFSKIKIKNNHIKLKSQLTFYVNIFLFHNLLLFHQKGLNDPTKQLESLQDAFQAHAHKKKKKKIKEKKQLLLGSNKNKHFPHKTSREYSYIQGLHLP